MVIRNFRIKSLCVRLINVLIFVFFALSFTSFIFKKPKLNVVLLVNDTGHNDSYFRSLSEMVFFNSKRKIKDFTIHHFSDDVDNKVISWNNGKKKVIYRPFQKSCDFSFCSSVRTLIVNHHSDENHALFNDESSECDFSDLFNSSKVKNNILDPIYLNTYIEKHYDEITHKDNRTLFIIFNNPKEGSLMKVSNLLDEYRLTKGEEIIIEPVFSTDIKKVEWSGYENLTCITCDTIKYSPEYSHVLELKVSRDKKCKELTKRINIVVEENSAKTSDEIDNNKCVCNSPKLNSIKDVFGSISHPKYTDKISLGDWKILSRESGGYVFDFITEPSCAPQYIVEIFDSKDKLIWKELYELDEVNINSRNDLQKLYPDKFIFVLSLYDIINQIKRSEALNLKITPLDENKQDCLPYVSPKLIFSKCQ